MSHVRKNKIRDYWSTDKLIEMKMFGQVMSRNRFHAILQMLHFSKSVVTNMTSLGRLYKINPVLCSLNRSISNNFTAFEKVAIDETLFLFKGKLSFRQFILSKRARFGIKLFVLSDCETGYVISVLPYVGSQTELSFAELNEKVGMTGQVVLTLLEPFFDLGHKLYLDNWYVSPCLAVELHKRKVNMCGTVRPDRKGLPKKLPQLDKGQVDVHHTEQMMYQRWQDKREVRMLTTMHGHEMHESDKVDHETGQRVVKPSSILEYNQHMGAIDVGDMQLSFNCSARKSIKWYKKLFFHFLDISIRNSHILQKTVQGKNVQLNDFRKELVREILERHSQPRSNVHGGRPSPGPLRLRERHFLEPIPPTAKQQRPRRYCHVCTNSSRKPKQRKETYYMCGQCEVPLCVFPCMKDYHTLRNF